MHSSHLRARVKTRRFQIAAAGTAVLATAALHAGTASASTSQTTVVADPIALQVNPGAEVAQFRALGVSTVRVMLGWRSVAPDASSTHAPRFSATNPGAYPARNWTQWDNAVRALTAAGIKVDLDIMGGPPRWADGSGAPSQYSNPQFGWKVNAKDYGEFAQAVATRYDGHYRGLPKVSIFSLWNEPNLGQQLGPENIDATSHSSGYDVAAGYYRSMVRDAYSALHRSNSRATILVGELAGSVGHFAPKSHNLPQGLPGDSGLSEPQPWIQTLYCLDSHDRALTGTAAKLAGCPTTGSARGSFVKDNPALFDASAISIHPYASQLAVTDTKIPSGNVVLSVIGRLTSEMSAVTRAWHHTHNFPVWSTEYGFITSPPQKNSRSVHYPSPNQAATDINEAEYLSWRNPRVGSYAQYLLADPGLIKKGAGLFASGLEYSNGKQKPGYGAFRLPLWLPSQTVNKGSSVQIWGGARPAVYAASLGATGREVAIQMESHGKWTTIHTVNVSASNGYFDINLKPSASGSMRLAYTYPSSELGLPVGYAGSTVYSRTVNVTVK